MELSASNDKDRDGWLRALRREVQPPPPPPTGDTKVKRHRDRVHTKETVEYFKRQAELEIKRKVESTVKLHTGGKKFDRNVANVGGHGVSMHYAGRQGEPIPKAPERKEKPVSADVGIMIAVCAICYLQLFHHLKLLTDLLLLLLLSRVISVVGW
jgi:hypothetical protein